MDLTFKTFGPKPREGQLYFIGSSEDQNHQREECKGLPRAQDTVSRKSHDPGPHIVDPTSSEQERGLQLDAVDKKCNSIQGVAAEPRNLHNRVVGTTVVGSP